MTNEAKTKKIKEQKQAEFNKSCGTKEPLQLGAALVGDKSKLKKSVLDCSCVTIVNLA